MRGMIKEGGVKNPLNPLPISCGIPYEHSESGLFQRG
jgi:hypothetical protein